MKGVLSMGEMSKKEADTRKILEMVLNSSSPDKAEIATLSFTLGLVVNPFMRLSPEKTA